MATAKKTTPKYKIVLKKGTPVKVKPMNKRTPIGKNKYAV